MVEGIDGAGKTTCASALAQWCGERGIACVFSKEPTSGPWGKKLRESAEARLSLDEELDLFYKDRAQHVQDSIQPALEAGGVVILDRYYWSTAAYQGARGADIAKILRYNEERFPIPDLVLLLDLPVEVGQERIRKRGDEPNQFENAEYLSKCREIFLKLPTQSQACSVVVNSSKDWRAVAKECLALFRETAKQKLGESSDSEALHVFES